MHALLILGGNIENRKHAIEKTCIEWGIGPHDMVTLTPEEATIGIGQVREFQKRLTLTPYASPFTVGIIYDMHTLTIEAQNALLKTLEEPPPHAKIIGETTTDSSFLPTITSRMQTYVLPQIALDRGSTKEAIERIVTWSQLTPGNRLVAIEKYSDSRQNALSFVESSTAALEQSIYDLQSTISLSTLALWIRTFLEARRELNANVNVRLVMDNLVLAL